MFPTPPDGPEGADIETEEAAVRPPAGPADAVTMLVEEGDAVARGAPVACLRRSPDISFVSPIAGRVARIDLLPGRRLSEVVIFREEAGGIERHETDPTSVGALRALLQGAGFWPLLRRRPFGGMPDHREVPAAIVVMAADTRPFAPDPRSALKGREDAFSRGLSELARLTEGPVLVCEAAGRTRLDFPGQGRRIRSVTCGPMHPQGLPGIRIHDLCPAGIDAPVWDIHAEDVAALGDLVGTGVLPMMRRVRVAGAGLRETRELRTHPGADLRQLTQRIVAPGAHVLLAGSPIDGRPARWLGTRVRQVTVLPREAAPRRRPHWLVAALTRSPAGRPAVPSAALTEALGGVIPAIPFVRALSSGDDDMAMRLGILSLLEEDVALADYVLGEGGTLVAELRAMLARIETEFAA